MREKRGGSGTNESILQETEANSDLKKKIKFRQSRFVHHIMKRKKLENLGVTDTFDGRKGKRKKSKYLNDMSFLQ